jgi:hypothetical protein
MVKIRMDYREKASGLLDLLQDTELILEVGPVPCGDYIINDAITIDGLAKNPSSARVRLSAGLGWGWNHWNSLPMAGEGEPSTAEQKVVF